MRVLGNGNFDIELITEKRVWLWLTRAHKLCKQMRSGLILDNGTIVVASSQNTRC